MITLNYYYSPSGNRGKELASHYEYGKEISTTLLISFDIFWGGRDGRRWFSYLL